MLLDYQNRFNQYAATKLPRDSEHIGQIYHAINYCFEAGGKRLRPALVYAVADSIGVELNLVDELALAIECIHTYSLIHDDLPAMDNDDFRRGKPACHKRFGQATAILAGDALNTFAFELLSANTTVSASTRLQQIHILAQCAGISGMVGGQDTDLTCENAPNSVTLSILSQLHQRKTAKLIEASLLLPYLSSPTASIEKQAILSEAALTLGLFYQIQDDILDVTQTSDVLGKPGGSDIDNGKSTYVSLLGLSGAKAAADEAKQTLTTQLNRFFSDANAYRSSPLAQIIDLIISRQH